MADFGLLRLAASLGCVLAVTSPAFAINLNPIKAAQTVIKAGDKALTKIDKGISSAAKDIPNLRLNFGKFGVEKPKNDFSDLRKPLAPGQKARPQVIGAGKPRISLPPQASNAAPPTREPQQFKSVSKLKIKPDWTGPSKLKIKPEPAAFQSRQAPPAEAPAASLNAATGGGGF